MQPEENISARDQDAERNLPNPRRAGKILDCSIEYVENVMRSIAVTADTGLEVDELDLRELLGEQLPEGYIRVGKPLKPMLLN